MGMERISDERSFFSALLDLIAHQFGEDVEIVLHDFNSEDAPHSIVDIRNGHITGRSIGDCVDKHGIQAVPGTKNGDDFYNEVIYTEDGKVLRGSTISIKGSDGKIIGSICINQDITKSVEYEGYLRQLNGVYTKNETSDISNLLTQLIQEAVVFIGKHPSIMVKEDKIAVIKYLDDRCAFLISKSGPQICETLNISKFTLYNYLEIARK